MVGQETSNGEDLTMSTFPVPDYVSENAARLEKMSKDFGATLPKDMAAAISLMSHPAAGIAALTAIGFGVAGQAFGLWAGAVAGAAEASQRLFAPLASNGDEPSVAGRSPATVTAFARPKPVLKVVTKTEPAPAVLVKAEPAGKPVAKAEPAKRVVAKAEPVKKPAAAAPKVEAAPAAAKAAAPALMPEDFHKPRAIKRPAAPDDLKAISGIGPKLEKVLNDLGVWTYAQVAAWGKEEVAWVDDYLSFSGRIGRDKWIEQAAALVAASARPRKG
jgi:NADH-quinone oxidoreductase subunit E